MAPQQEDLAKWQGFIARLTALRDAAATVNRAATFDVLTARSSDESVATVSIHGRPAVSTYSLILHQAAQAHKIITVSVAAGAAALGLSGIGEINGHKVRISPSDSLNDIAVKMTRADASIRAQTVHLGPSDFRLILTANELGAAGAITLAEMEGDAFRQLGLNSPSAQLVAPRDARFTLDGTDHEWPGSVCADQIAGVTINVTGAPVAGQSLSATITIGVDTTKTVNAVQDFVHAYNDWLGSLSGDAATCAAAESITAGLHSVEIGDAGLAFGPAGELALDRSALESALAHDPARVRRVFTLEAVCSHPAVAFVGASAKTRDCGSIERCRSSSGEPADVDSGGFAVEITRPAGVTRVTAAMAQCEASRADERLTFHGPLFPVKVTLTLPAGSTREDTLARIRRSARLRGRIDAEIDTAGRLVLTSGYGKANVFSVTSDSPASAETSGIGETSDVTVGFDVAGTIHGEPAAGVGRTLTGCEGNEYTEALQILVDAAEPGPYGSVFLTRGIADRICQAVHQLIDPGQRSMRAADVTAQIDDIETQIMRMNDQLGAFGDYLEQALSAVDLRVYRLREQIDALNRRKIA